MYLLHGKCPLKRQQTGNKILNNTVSQGKLLHFYVCQFIEASSTAICCGIFDHTGFHHILTGTME